MGEPGNEVESGALEAAGGESPCRSCMPVLIGALLVSAGVVFQHTREEQARLVRTAIRTCLGIQRTLSGAAEIWQSEGRGRLTDLDGEVREGFLREGILQVYPWDPGFGPDSWVHYRLSPASKSGVICFRHGARETTPPELATRPRELLERSGVTDPAVLARAAVDARDNPGWTSNFQGLSGLFLIPKLLGGALVGAILGAGLGKRLGR